MDKISVFDQKPINKYYERFNKNPAIQFAEKTKII
jgi:hypothetical protein